MTFESDCDPTATRGRYVTQVATGMWVKTWDGHFRQVADDPETDFAGFVTLRFTDGTATSIRREESVTVRIEED